MPVIPAYRPRYTIPGESGNAQQDVGSAGVVGNAIAQFGKVGMNAADNLGDALWRRDQELKTQATDNLLIQKGAELNNEALNFEQEYKKTYRGTDAAGSIQKVSDFTKQLGEKYAIEGNEKANIKIKQHLLALDNNLKNSLSSYEAQEIKAASTNTRNFDLESSLKMSQQGQVDLALVNLALVNYQRTLDTQLGNKSISAEEYAILKKTGVSKIREANIESVLAADPVRAQAVFNSVKNELTTDTQERLEKVLKPSVTRQTGMDIGTAVFKADTTGSLEKMIDTVKAKEITPESKEIAIAAVKDQWNVRKADETRVATEAKESVLKILNPIARERGDGTNKQSDLTPAQWADLEQKNPDFAKTLQDSMRRERDYLENQAKAEARAVEAEKRSNRQEAAAARQEIRQARQEKRYEQAENESAILLDPNFAKRDIAADYALKRIDTSQYLKLKGLQEKADPVKSDTFKRALSRVTAGTALADSVGLKGSDAVEVAVWKQKYGDLVKAFAYNNYDKPDFDAKMTEFVEKNVLSEMVTSLFSLDSTDRQRKFKEAQKVAGELPAKGTETKIIGGKAYTKRDGKWFEQ